ncbi:N-acetylmuramoyl-L-alanine amidase [Solibacillus sp. FSL K6-1781]|uniref:N-acetylmuramoyl-L-alanine amidase n=1 Tax=Solibacillus sp. FSL K6-1781 TaxID=2921474 RepID=UPI00315A6171
MITISGGHYGKGTGALGLIDEGEENIRVAKEVTAILRASSITTNYIEDNVSKSAKQNIPWLIAMHNKTDREIDVSIHFNSSPGTHSKGIGTETLVYSDKNKAVAQKITDAIANASGLKNRGVKIRTDLGLLKGTNKPCYLIEVCFVNDSVDVALYRRDFDKICRAIANELAKAVGKSLKPSVNTSTVEGKEARTLDINSPSLNDIINGILNSKGQREIILNYAIDEGAHKSWLDKLNDRTITNDEILALAAMSIVNLNK